MVPMPDRSTQSPKPSRGARANSPRASASSISRSTLRVAGSPASQTTRIDPRGPPER